MNIRLDTIAVKNLGPLGEASFELDDLNLIYSPNEGGKTFLTALVTQCLFAHTDRWQFRDLGTGKVHVSGLADEPQAYTKTSEPKLDEQIADRRGLPPSLAKLLVVKGSSVSLEGDGAGKSVLKDLLSGRGLLEDVEDNISATVRNADIATEPIDIHKRGEGKDLQETKDDLQTLTKLMETIENEYSPGELQQLQLQKEQCRKQLEEQQQARRYRAYEINQQLQALEEKSDQYDEELVTSLAADIESYREKQTKLERKQSNRAEAQNRADVHRWLKEAKDNYRQLQNQPNSKQSAVWQYLAVGVFIISVVITLAVQPIAGVVGFGVSTAVLGYLLYQKNGGSNEVAAHEELGQLKSEFEDKTGRKLTGITTLDDQLSEYGQARGRLDQLDNDIKNLKDDLDSLTASISQSFQQVIGESPKPEAWAKQLQEIRSTQKELSRKREELQEKLQRLQVDSQDYISNDPGTEFDREKFSEYKEKTEKMQEKVEDKKQQLTDITRKMRTKLSSEAGSFPELYQQLQTKQSELEDRRQAIKTEIVAGRLVHEVVSDLRAQEDERIQSTLTSDRIQDYVRSMTNGHYTGVQLRDDRLFVISETEDFPLAEISTGTREQVLMGLRTGMASYLCADKPLFLWLDDAFQNSDWQRREALVSGLQEMVQNGWQITYLTMDDHIRDLLQAAGEEMDAGFSYIQL